MEHRPHVSHSNDSSLLQAFYNFPYVRRQWEITQVNSVSFFPSCSSVSVVSLFLRASGHSWTQQFGTYSCISCQGSFVKYLFALSWDHSVWVPLKLPQLLKHGLPEQMETEMCCHIILSHGMSCHYICTQRENVNFISPLAWWRFIIIDTHHFRGRKILLKTF